MKVKSSVYLEEDLKERAKEFFHEYGMSLSEGLNYLLKKTLKSKDDLGLVKVEPLGERDPDYKIAKRAKEHYKKHPEDYVDFDEINWD